MKGIQHINLLCITGPTASGKTELATRIAYELDGEVISADSRQVYRDMNIGTGKDLTDYTIKGVHIPYHLIDIADPGSEYNVYEYQKDFLLVFNHVRKNQKLPILCGGTGLYIEAVLKGYRMISVPVNEELRRKLESLTMKQMEDQLSSFRLVHNTTDTVSRKRLIRAIEIETYYSQNPEEAGNYPEIKPLILGINPDREKRRNRITERLIKRLQSGMVEEVQGLLSRGIPPEKLIYYGLEYKYLTLYLTGKMNYDDMFKRLNIAIHQFAKRQMTWFRKMEREGFKIHWLDGNMDKEAQFRNAMEIIRR